MNGGAFGLEAHKVASRGWESSRWTGCHRIRPDVGGFFGVGECDGPKLDNFEGRFAQLLPPKRPGAEGIELARAMLARWASPRSGCAATLGGIGLLGVRIGWLKLTREDAAAIRLVGEMSRSCRASGAASKKSMAGDKVSITAFAHGLVK